jgi:hypothetical protein
LEHGYDASHGEAAASFAREKRDDCDGSTSFETLVLEYVRISAER